MATSIITDWTILQNEAAIGSTATLPTFSAGSDRIVEIGIAAYNGSGNASTATAVSSNGQTATLIDAQVVGVGRVALGFYQFLESQISSINGQTLTTAGASGGPKTVIYRVLGGCKQSSPFAANKAYSAITAVLTMPLSRAADSLTTVVGFSSTTGQVLTSTNPSRDGSVTMTSGRTINYGSDQDTLNTSNTTVSGNSRTSVAAWNRESAPSQSITSINDDDELDSGVENTAVVVGYDDGVNPVVSGTVGSLALTGVSQTGTTVSLTPPAPTNAAYWPEPDATHTLTLTDGTNPSTFSAPFRPIPGYTSVVVASPDNADEYKLGYWATFPLEDDDVIMFDPPNPAPPDSVTGWTVNADGSFTDAPNGLKTWYHWRNATSLMYIYEATIGEGGIVDVGVGIAYTPNTFTPFSFTPFKLELL